MEQNDRETTKKNEMLEDLLPISSRMNYDHESLSNITSLLSHDGKQHILNNPDEYGEEYQKIYMEW